MVRAFSYILVIAGLVLAGLGLHSVWTSRQAEQQAEEQWDTLSHSQQQQPAPKAIHRVGKGETFARLSIPRLDSHWIVFEGADKSELRMGPGHLIQTALPGSRGNCVIAGHRDTQFRVLQKVKIGEDISVEIEGRTFVYRVTDRHVVSPTDTHPLKATATSSLTLVTCYPFYYVGPAPKRFVIRAELVS
jgi:sortase A